MSSEADKSSSTVTAEVQSRESQTTFRSYQTDSTPPA